MNVVRSVRGRICGKYEFEKGSRCWKVFLNLPHLVVMVADPEYILAMKSLSARIDATDGGDIVFLAKALKITSVEEVFEIIEKYYPRRMIKPATQFFLEEVFSERADRSGS
ncbi:MAG: hypothetical protein H8E10_15460 [Desulfobacterales bacterium]|nr:hypothetical protein [Desulfobacterales bacterium]